VAHLQPWEAKTKAEKKLRRLLSRSQNQNPRRDAKCSHRPSPSRTRYAGSALVCRAIDAGRLSLFRREPFPHINPATPPQRRSALYASAHHCNSALARVTLKDSLHRGVHPCV
jgi:hypothetical protein